MRYHVKGGIWKNTEDEILKAAVMKYGLNQWSRISSLLVRKSAKQCKERWYEWLDPCIKKTEWTKDEEEKLLHLSKMFPCQWRTIAPMVGRTAYQVMEHYEKLLDRAQNREPDENDPRKLRPGEIDPNPETKPARPDPIDMDEDEKEMLNEARARLANTRGKKAKRKAREKQLEEARRLAALQKKRELKAAGIDVVLRLPRKKKKEMNYNADIPFERKLPEGTWTYGKEEFVQNRMKGVISMQFLENRNRDDVEELQRQKDKRAMKKLKDKNLPEAIEIINRLNDPTNIVQRAKLIIPDPQVTEKDLEGISKLTNNMGFSESSIIESNATKVLMGEYSQREMAPLSMIRTPKVEDIIMKEAKVLISLKEGQTPLLGGENSANDLQNYLDYRRTDLIKGGVLNQFKTPLPITPNLLSQSIMGQSLLTNNHLNDGKNSEHGGSSTPGIKTPLRDEMKINIDDDINNVWENSSVSKASEVNAKANKPQSKTYVKSLLYNLPKPANNYEIDIMDSVETIKADEEEENKLVEDANDKINRLKREKDVKDRHEMLTQSKVIQRKLIRPTEINDQFKIFSQRILLDKIKNDEIEPKDEEIVNTRFISETMIQKEILALMHHDNITFPQKGSKVKNMENDDMMDIDSFGREERNFAVQLIEEEMKSIKNSLNLEINQTEIDNLRDEINENIIYMPKEKKYITEVSDQEKFDNYNEIFHMKSKVLEKEEQISKKLEEKANILNGGYMKRFSILMKAFETKAKQVEELKDMNNIYNTLFDQERAAILKRKSDLENEISIFKEKERGMQSKYKTYQERLSMYEN